jgi:hypothetical protein
MIESSRAIDTSERFGFQWDLHREFHPHYREQFLQWIAPLGVSSRGSARPKRRTAAAIRQASESGSVFEAFLVVTAGALLWLATLAMHLSPELLLFGGLWTTGAGFALGLPTGAIYHYVLYRSLERADALPEGWYWRPLSHHDRVPAADRFAVLAWCYAGAAGFFVILIGLAITTVGALRIV